MGVLRKIVVLTIASAFGGCIVACSGNSGTTVQPNAPGSTDLTGSLGEIVDCAELYPDWIADQAAKLSDGGEVVRVAADRSWGRTPIAAMTLSQLTLECGTVFVFDAAPERAARYVIRGEGATIEDFDAASGVLVALGFVITSDDMPRQTVREARAAEAGSAGTPTSAASSSEDGADDAPRWWERYFEYVPGGGSIVEETAMFGDDSGVWLRFYPEEFEGSNANDLELYFSPGQSR